MELSLNPHSPLPIPHPSQRLRRLDTLARCNLAFPQFFFRNQPLPTTVSRLNGDVTVKTEVEPLYLIEIKRSPHRCRCMASTRASAAARRAPERPDVVIIKHLRLVSRVARPWRCTALGASWSSTISVTRT